MLCCGVFFTKYTENSFRMACPRRPALPAGVYLAHTGSYKARAGGMAAPASQLRRAEAVRRKKIEGKGALLNT